MRVAPHVTEGVKYIYIRTYMYKNVLWHQVTTVFTGSKYLFSKLPTVTLHRRRRITNMYIQTHAPLHTRTDTVQ